MGSITHADTQKSHFEKFVCHLYSTKKSNVNDARFKIFEKKHKVKTTDKSFTVTSLSENLTPTHLERVNYGAKIWKSAGTAMVDLPTLAQHRWNEEGDIFWTDDIFPGGGGGGGGDGDDDEIMAIMKERVRTVKNRNIPDTLIFDLVYIFWLFLEQVYKYYYN